MLEPTGPLPPEIYWRRRALAVGVGVVVLALVVWLVLSLTGGGDDPEPDPAAAGVLTSETSTTRTPTSSTGSEEADGVAAAGPGGSSGGSDSGSSQSGSSQSGSSQSSTTSGSAGSSSSAAASASAVAAGQCPDQSLAVRVTADRPNYQVGEEPEFTIVITNIGTAACERDLGAGLQQVLVYSLDGSRRLWANTDCFPESTADVRKLAPGDQAAFAVKWSGTTSEPGCQAPRERVPAGAYTVVGQLGGLRSTPEPFNIA
ncbi:hypothetical protein RAJCM14343_0835 [Rhodococcus aetherivorans]|uniref:DUF4232 domain-containing protein n=1 Tax=Rhodococcus aetherivorans TaxID=191292 RepID=A0ABQ0YGB8_9NOCA|nr:MULTISPECIES: hypothetical protein [Rhodococcus]ETT28308.1 protein of unknown function DUF11 [Rhodococcus rhodochrous ATCC 21198]MDV6295576.1 hypothetical protein [Rhodococcus aetherivorans]NGP26880.1 hypothetical protein [Rhodococcus aetherivorans]QIX48737.1 hypothetical protein HFP48_03685 [Rhodococcus sp. DMU1]CCW15534.1 hypothetical protein EBESD8_61110 [Rhodococcus aetherivorans]